MMRQTTLASLGIAALFVLVACDETLGTPGELGEGYFTYECLSEADIGCENTTTFDKVDIPSAIAVGSTFDLKFHSKPARIVPSSETLVQPSERGFLAIAPGKTAMLATDTMKQRVFDLVYINLVDLHSIRLDGTKPAGPSITINPKDTVTWTARPIFQGALVPGSLLCTWTTSDKNVVRWQISLEGSENTLYAMAPGTATVTVEAGDVSTSIEVTVVP